ncbi:NAD-dependent epimerase/dehydratase family protein [Bacillus sp. Marseille-P3661]|uniref:NAD-dependent epimerase/dehydratase family protein n=1 Tax=Bacillus sp. Marseille-P3661 TaxID=1936234 RepID=UPI000C858713|nr:NAD-dependent epimerase/dehydratase family protein [Bacillus sp. Marseille-P3661]
MKIIVTGGAGFIGSHIAERLVEQGHSVVIIDNLKTGTKENLGSHMKLYQEDIRSSNIESIFKYERPDAIIHHAAQLSVSLSHLDPFYDFDVNTQGTVNLLKCCAKHDVKSFIFASSAAVYGNPTILPIPEDHLLSPCSFYGLSKRCAEDYIILFSKNYNFNYTIFRYGNVYGPRQSSKGESGVINIFTERILTKQPLIIHGDGLQTRDFIYVSDVVEANIKALTSEVNGIFNIGSGTGVSINEMIALLKQTAGNLVTTEFSVERAGDIKHSLLNINKAKTLLNWTPQTALEHGIKQTFQSISTYNNKPHE